MNGSYNLRGRLFRVVFGLAFLLFFTALAQTQATAAESPGPLKFGAIWPLTGSQAAVGQEAERGLSMAIDQINSTGGILGRKVELVLEDDKSDPSVGVAAINKLLTSEKMDFFVPGYSSTVSNAFLSRMQSAHVNILSVVNGATSSEIEQEFGKEPWLFKLYPYDYHYQQSNVSFLKTLNPRPKSVAIVYEDTLFGTTQGRYANEFMKEAGFNVVLFEPFKSGTSDLSPLLTRVKSAHAEMLYWIGYFGDCMLLVKQSKEINYNPDLFVGSTVWTGMPEFADGLGKDSNYVVGIDLWTPDVKYPASKSFPSAFPSTDEWTGQYVKRFGRQPNHWALVAYISVEIIAQAAKEAHSIDSGEIAKALRQINTMTPMGPLSFKQSKFGGTQGFTDMIVFQWMNGKRTIVYPPDVATGKLQYPTPPWDKR